MTRMALALARRGHAAAARPLALLRGTARHESDYVARFQRRHGLTSSGLPPTAQQVALAQRLAASLGVDPPAGISTDVSVCSEFIDRCKADEPPTLKQLTFATSLADKHNIPLPEAARRRKRSCSAFIDAALKGRPLEDPSLPSDRQIEIAVDLARELREGLPHEALASTAAMRAHTAGQRERLDELIRRDPFRVIIGQRKKHK